MAAKNIQELYDEARVIYTASTEGENTQVRIGQMFYDLIEHLYEISDVNGTVGPITPTPTPSTLGGPLLTSFNNMPIPTDPDQILHWIDSEDKWEFIDTPTGGGSGGSGDVTWLDLKTDNGSADDNKQINLSHLKNALSGYLENNLTGNNSLYSWWGQKLQKNTNTTPATYRITNAPLEGVTYIRFTNDVILGVDPSSAENTLCVYNSDLTKVGHIYATGGVSALGNSSSGGGSPTPGTPVDLRGLLSHISSSSYSPDYANTTAVSNALLALPDNGAGATIRWNGSKWIVDKTIFDDIANITDNGGSFLKKEDDGYSWSDPDTGTSGSTTLSGLQDTTISSLAPGQLLYCQDATDKWVNKTFAINSDSSSLSPGTLQNIAFGGTKYTLPVADGNTAGIVSAGTGLSASSGTLNHSNSITAANSSFGLYKLKYDAQGHITGTTSVEKADITALGIPGQDTNTTYSAGNGLNPLDGGTVFSVKAASGGGLTVDNDGVKISNTYGGTKTIWGQTYWSGGQPQNVDGTISAIVPANLGGLKLALSGQSSNAASIVLNPVDADRNVISMFGKTLFDVNKSTNNGAGSIELGYFSQTNGVGQLSLYGQTISLINSKNVEILNATTAAKGLRIGDAILYWDADNQALALTKVSTTEHPGTVGNFYATGGVSALGMSNGTGSVDAMTFGTINVTNTVNLGNSKCFIKKDGTNTVISGKDSIILSADSVGVEGIISVMGMLIYDEENDKTYALNIQAAKNAGILTLVS